MSLQAVFFDVGFTLIHPAQPMAEVLLPILLEAGHVPPTREALEAAIHSSDLFGWFDPRVAGDAWGSPALINQRWRAYYCRIFERMGFAGDQARCADQAIAFYQRPQAWIPYPEVPEVLGLLQQQGYVLGAVSDWGPALTGILGGLGLTRYLDFVLVSANLGLPKPHSDLYQLALRRAGVLAEQALMVGDTYYSDILGARAAGVAGVLLDRSQARPPVDCPVIGDLRQLLALLGSLAEER